MRRSTSMSRRSCGRAATRFISSNVRSDTTGVFRLSIMPMGDHGQPADHEIADGMSVQSLENLTEMVFQHDRGGSVYSARRRVNAGQRVASVAEPTRRRRRIPKRRAGARMISQRVIGAPDGLVRNADTLRCRHAEIAEWQPRFVSIRVMSDLAALSVRGRWFGCDTWSRCVLAAVGVCRAVERSIGWSDFSVSACQLVVLSACYASSVCLALASTLGCTANGDGFHQGYH